MNQLVLTRYIMLLSAMTRLAGSTGRNEPDRSRGTRKRKRAGRRQPGRVERKEIMRRALLRRRREAGRGARNSVLIDSSAPRESGDLTRTTRLERRGLDGIGRVYRERSIGEVAAAGAGNRVSQRRLEIHFEKVHRGKPSVGAGLAVNRRRPVGFVGGILQVEFAILGSARAVLAQ